MNQAAYRHLPGDVGNVAAFVDVGSCCSEDGTGAGILRLGNCPAVRWRMRQQTW